MQKVGGINCIDHFLHKNTLSLTNVLPYLWSDNELRERKRTWYGLGEHRTLPRCVHTSKVVSLNFRSEAEVFGYNGSLYSLRIGLVTINLDHLQKLVQTVHGSDAHHRMASRSSIGMNAQYPPSIAPYWAEIFIIPVYPKLTGQSAKRGHTSDRSITKHADHKPCRPKEN